MLRRIVILASAVALFWGGVGVARAGTNGQGLYLHDIRGYADYVKIWGQNQHGTWVEWPCTPGPDDEMCWGRMPGHYMAIYNWWWVGTVYIDAYTINFQHIGEWTCNVPKVQHGNDFTLCPFD